VNSGASPLGYTSATPGPPPFLETLPVTRAAFAYAVQLHAGQLRSSDFAPFILHPLEVAQLLHGRGFDDEVIAAGLLHDAIEDTAATPADLRAGFGERVCELVRVVTDDPSIVDADERRRALREQVAGAGPEALAIFAADKLAKARELRATATRDPRSLGDPATRGRLEHYRASLVMLEREAPDLAYVGQLRFELWALLELPPRT
jgi:(p)ppGpp synthase/HD superfamily hydrolase